MSAWCYGAIHVGYASCSLALIVVSTFVAFCSAALCSFSAQGRQRLAEQERQPFQIPDMGFIFDRVYAVNDMFLGRDKQPTIRTYDFLRFDGSSDLPSYSGHDDLGALNSFLGIPNLTIDQPLIKYLNLQDSPDVKVWIQELFESAGTRFDELVYDRWGDANGMSKLAVRHSTPPPAMSPYPPNSTSAPPSNNASRRPSQSASVYSPNMHVDETRLLPSLKACGLLDWRTSASSNSSGPPSLAQGRSNPPTSSALPGDTATRGLPMGLSWLADDR